MTVSNELKNLTNKDLKKIIRSYKSNHCPAYSKLKNDGLKDLIMGKLELTENELRSYKRGLNIEDKNKKKEIKKKEIKKKEKKKK